MDVKLRLHEVAQMTILVHIRLKGRVVLSPQASCVLRSFLDLISESAFSILCGSFPLGIVPLIGDVLIFPSLILRSCSGLAETTDHWRLGDLIHELYGAGLDLLSLEYTVHGSFLKAPAIFYRNLPGTHVHA